MHNIVKSILKRIPTDFYGPNTIRLYPVGYLCNHMCPMCWRQNLIPKIKSKTLIRLENQHLKIDEYKKILDHLPPLTRHVEIVGGGEPLLYESLLDLTTMIKNKQLYGSIITNGTLLTTKLSLHLLSIGWDNLRISVHASNKNIYKKINGVDTFNEVWTNIKQYLALKKANTNSKIGVLFVIQKMNYNDVYNFARKAEKVGCDYIEFDSLFLYGRKLLLTEVQVKSVIQQLQKISTSLTIKNNATHVIDNFKTQPKTSRSTKAKVYKYYRNKICLIPSESLIINQFGQIHPCCFLDFAERETVVCGNLRENSYNLWRIWRNVLYRNVRQRLRAGIFYKTCYQYCNYTLQSKINY